MNKKMIIIISILLAVGILEIWYMFAQISKDKGKVLPEAGIVQTKEDAIIIGKTIITRVYPQFDYDNLNWGALYLPDSDVWSIFCYEEGVMGGHPQIDIKKKTGEVVSIRLYK